MMSGLVKDTLGNEMYTVCYVQDIYSPENGYSINLSSGK